MVNPVSRYLALSSHYFCQTDDNVYSYTLIYPYLSYGLLSWGTACQTKLKKTKISHNKCLRCIFFADKRENATPHFTLLEILKLENIFKLKIGSLVHKFQKNKKETTPTLHDLFSLASDIHKYNTRFATSQNLYRPFYRTNYGLARFRVVASQTRETIPLVVKCLPYNVFKKKYKLLLLDSQTWIIYINVTHTMHLCICCKHFFPLLMYFHLPSLM